MSLTQPNQPIAMLRSHLREIPQYALPDGYTARWYQPGDEQAWIQIHLAADLYNPISAELFTRQFGAKPELLAERQCYLLDSAGQPIGTATAWFNDDYDGAAYGRVHWVALRPEWQGRGLAKPLLTIICHRLRELGHTQAYLTTSTVRVPAINLYCQFGFMPKIATAADLAIWRELQKELKEDLKLNQIKLGAL